MLDLFRQFGFYLLLVTFSTSNTGLAITDFSTNMVMRACHKALLLATVLVISFWVSFIFGGTQAEFNDWHYDYRVLSYGLNRPEKHDSLGRIPAKFKSTRGYGNQYAINADDMAYG